MFKAIAIALSLLFFSLHSFAGEETVTVVAKGYKFEPAEITVKLGTKVRWENREKRQYHSVYFESLGDPQGNYLFPGDSREITFTEAGTYPYICEPHITSHDMKGLVHVVE